MLRARVPLRTLCLWGAAKLVQVHTWQLCCMRVVWTMVRSALHACVVSITASGYPADAQLDTAQPYDWAHVHAQQHVHVHVLHSCMLCTQYSHTQGGPQYTVWPPTISDDSQLHRTSQRADSLVSRWTYVSRQTRSPSACEPLRDEGIAQSRSPACLSLRSSCSRAAGSTVARARRRGRAAVWRQRCATHARRTTTRARRNSRVRSTAQDTQRERGRTHTSRLRQQRLGRYAARASDSGGDGSVRPAARVTRLGCDARASRSSRRLHARHPSCRPRCQRCPRRRGWARAAGGRRRVWARPARWAAARMGAGCGSTVGRGGARSGSALGPVRTHHIKQTHYLRVAFVGPEFRSVSVAVVAAGPEFRSVPVAVVVAEPLADLTAHCTQRMPRRIWRCISCKARSSIPQRAVI